jgi:ABC-type cobalamin/Fe3+-siderophores transport system ATPase subunit
MNCLSAENVSLTRGDAAILSNISCRFGQTGSIAVVGPNGAGKSTLLKLLAGVIPPSEGAICIGAEDLQQMPAAARARTIGYVPQSFQPHWDLTVTDLVQLGAERGPRPAFSFVADDAMARFGLSTLRDRRWSTLSGGEQARVLLAMVLAVEPPFLVADEPGASLDIRHRIDLVDILVRRSTGSLSIVAMHDLDLAFRFFDRVVVINRGRIALDGPPADLIKDVRLDAIFGVTFERLASSGGLLLRAVR